MQTVILCSFGLSVQDGLVLEFGVFLVDKALGRRLVSLHDVRVVVVAHGLPKFLTGFSVFLRDSAVELI